MQVTESQLRCIEDNYCSVTYAILLPFNYLFMCDIYQNFVKLNCWYSTNAVNNTLPFNSETPHLVVGNNEGRPV
jgi:hypothetical protein